MDVSKSFDEIYNDQLTAHFNKSGATPGTLIRVIYWSVSVCAWGLYKVANFIGRQIVADTASRYWLEKHAKMRGLSLDADESNADLLSRYTDDIQNPPGGGDGSDWVRWAKAVTYTHDEGLLTEWIESVVDAFPKENARGLGSMNLVIISDRIEAGFEGVATSELRSAVSTFCHSQRMLGVCWDLEVYPATPLPVDVSMSIEADNFDLVKSQIEEQLPAYLNSLLDVRKLTIVQITSIAERCGATDVLVSTPSGSVEPDNGPTAYERIVAGTLTVTEIV